MKHSRTTLYSLALFFAFSACSSGGAEKPRGISNQDKNRFVGNPPPESGNAGPQGGCQTNNCQPLSLSAQFQGNVQTSQDGRQQYWFSEINRSVNWAVSIVGANSDRPLRVFTNLSGATMQQQGGVNTWQVNWVPTKAKQDNLEIYARDLKRCQLSGSNSCDAPQFNSVYDFKVRIAYFVEKLTQTTDQNGNVFCNVGAALGVAANASQKINNGTGGLFGAIASGLSQSGSCDNLRNYTARAVTTTTGNPKIDSTNDFNPSPITDYSNVKFDNTFQTNPAFSNSDPNILK